MTPRASATGSTAPPGLPLAVEDLAVEAVGEDGRSVRLLAVERLSCPAGAHVAVMGPSGSGKTTLLHALAGLLRPSRGRVVWGGEDIVGLSERARDVWRRRRVGLVFQDFHLVPELDVVGNVLLPIRFAGWRVPAPTRARADELIAAVGLAQPRQRVRFLSRGEQQRAAVARALLMQPSIILADEPTASLDTASAEIVTGLLCDLARQAGATLLVATHDHAFAGRLGTLWTLRGGRIAADEARAA